MPMGPHLREGARARWRARRTKRWDRRSPFPRLLAGRTKGAGGAERAIAAHLRLPGLGGDALRPGLPRAPAAARVRRRCRPLLPGREKPDRRGPC